MKTTGIVRKIDPVGRIVVPKELRRTLGVAEGDPMEILADEDAIILRKYQPDNTCYITGEVSNDNIKLLDGKLILSREGVAELLHELNEKVSEEYE